jgi:predicted alpha/beta hydrolase
MTQLISLSADNYALPLEVSSAAQPRAQLLFLPALGVQAKLYRKFAETLSAQGISTVVMEQRGHGRSELRPSRQLDYGFKDWLLDDIPTALAWMEQQQPTLPVYLGGHSLGGHLGLMASALNPGKLAGIVLMTTATPWYRCYGGRAALQIRTLIAAVTGTTRLLGYYPGDKLGFGGREARSLMQDWLVMAKHNRYSAAGIDRDIEALVQADTCPVLSVYCDKDNFGPLPAIQGVTRRLTRREVEIQQITSAELGARADHVSWAKHPAPAAAAIVDWISKRGWLQ